jgi:MFS family permease
LASALNFSQAAIVYGVLSLMALVILPYMKVPAAAMPLYYVYGNAAALLGGLTAAVLVQAWGRQASLFVSYTLTTCAIVVIYAMHTLPGMVFGYCLIQYGVTWAYISGYVVSSEILPTRIRASGLGVSVAVGRLGAVIAPLMLTKMYAASGTPSAALAGLLVLALPGPLAAALWWVKGRETRDLSLEQGSAEPTDAWQTGQKAPATAP